MNTKNVSGEAKAHEVIMTDRRELMLNGVRDVISFDEGLVELITEMGLMTVEGEEIHISLLDTENGRLTLTGKMSGIYYTDKAPRKKTGLFGGEKR